MVMVIRLKNGQLESKVRLKDGLYTLTPVRKTRSTSQNSYYWGVLVKHISEETGYSEDETHAKLAYKFLLIKDSKTPYVKSTTKLSTTEFEEYNEKIRQWASSFLSLSLPLPNEI